MNETMSGLDVESVLYAHRRIRDDYSHLCACGEWRDKRDDGTGHRAHVGAVIRAQIATWLASEAQVEHIANWIPLGFEERDPYDNVNEAARAVLKELAALVAPSRELGEKS